MHVFTHIPKTAGTSIKESLISRYGEENILFDYSRPLSDGETKRNLKCIAYSFFTNRKTSKQMVFGHFMTGKYCDFWHGKFTRRSGYSYATFLRDPLQRAISHFHYWKRINGTDNKIWVKFTREKWDLERFLTSGYFANFHSKFLYGCPLDIFDFVGISEQYERSIRLLGARIPFFDGLDVITANANPHKAGTGEYDVPANVRRTFASLNKQDYELYDAAMRKLDTMSRSRVTSSITPSRLPG